MPAQITPEPIQAATPAQQALPTQTPVAAQPVVEPQTQAQAPTPEPTITPTVQPTITTTTTTTTAQPAIPDSSLIAESMMDKMMKFKLYIMIFASVIGLATVGYVTYSFFFSGTTTTEITLPPAVSSPFGDTTTTTDATTTTTTDSTTTIIESNPPSLGGGNSDSSASQTNDFGKTVQDLKDVSTGTDQVYDNAVLEETTPSTMEVVKKIPR